MEDFFKDTAMQTGNMYNLSPLQAHKLCLHDAILVDVREEHLNRHKIFNVANLVFCPLKKLRDLLSQLPSHKPLIVADASGIHSSEAVKIMMENGFAGKCANLSGGLVSWEHAGLPVKINYDERIPGKLITLPTPEKQG